MDSENGIPTIPEDLSSKIDCRSLSITWPVRESISLYSDHKLRETSSPQISITFYINFCSL
jgi:hypothetical protein